MTPRLSRGGARAIDKSISDLFDSLKIRLLGPWAVPDRKSKKLWVGFTPDLTLQSIFEKAVTEEGGKIDTTLLDHLSEITTNYIDKYRADAQAKVKSAVQGAITDAYTGKVPVKEFESHVQDKVQDILNDITQDVTKVVAAQTRSAEVLGIKSGLDQINASMGIDDPAVAWICVHDNALCLEENEEIRLTQGRVGKVGDLKAGDLLAIPTHPTDRGNRKVLWTKKKQSPAVRLTFDQGREVVCTPDHPILVRAGPTFCFLEAARIEPHHDVVFLDELKDKGERQRVTMSLRAKPFMVGYQDSWDFWRQHSDDIVSMLREDKQRIRAMAKYNISVQWWDTYVKHVVSVYAPDVKLKSGTPNNRNNVEWRIRQVADWEKTYGDLGGDSWLSQAVEVDSVAALARRNCVGVRFLRKQMTRLALAPKIKAKAAKENWRKNRTLLVAKAKARGCPQFPVASKPEIAVGDLLSKHYKVERNVSISNMRVDFVLPEHGVVVEYDGSGHDMRDRMSKSEDGKGRKTAQLDFARDAKLRSMGYRVFRIIAPKDRVEPGPMLRALSLFVASDGGFGKWRA